MKHDPRRLLLGGLLAIALFGARGGVARAAHDATIYAQPGAPFGVSSEVPAVPDAHFEDPAQYGAPAMDPERAQLLHAEQRATGGARRVLAAASAMIDQAVVIRGSCATWLNAVYRRAGGRFGTVFQGNRRGRFADRAQLRPGDWVHFVNHSYGGVGHSAIFIGWTDPARSVALTLSHPGEQRAEPGRFREYDFTSVYRIDRMRD